MDDVMMPFHSYIVPSRRSMHHEFMMLNMARDITFLKLKLMKLVGLLSIGAFSVVVI